MDGEVGPGFKRWCIFLPRLVCEKVSLNSAYTLTRQQRNPAWFDQMRERLQLILQDCSLLQVSGKQCTPETGLDKAEELVLQSLLAAQGFLGNKQFHKAFVLGELCVQVADCITAPDLSFWPLLCRATLGNAYLRLRRFQEARQILEEALKLGAEEADSSCRAVLGACYYVLAHAELEEQRVDLAVDRVDAAIEEMEGHLWEISQSLEDKEVISSVFATAYHFRGHCDFVSDRFDVALSYYSRALKCLENHCDLGRDGDAMAVLIKHDIERAHCLKPK
ncbi:unnamed protein product [Effrenium voratum]|uniref:Uncharacterized protein n=1 Tax=Effrenium voratum TaxID=2562239 RepID=A0AA36J8E9_9DINO|nr:unnamed protein product [Effrenium voratum]